MLAEVKMDIEVALSFDADGVALAIDDAHSYWHYHDIEHAAFLDLQDSSNKDSDRARLRNIAKGLRRFADRLECL